MKPDEHDARHDLRRRRFRCRGCGSEVVPLDAALGLEPRIAHSLGVRERALWLVTEISYAKTAATLDALRRLPVSHGELHRWVADEGARIEATIVAETEAILGDQPTRAPTGRATGDVWVQADGTMVHGRTGAVFEATVGLVFRGTRRIGRTRTCPASSSSRHWRCAGVDGRRDLARWKNPVVTGSLCAGALVVEREKALEDGVVRKVGTNPL